MPETEEPKGQVPAPVQNAPSTPEAQPIADTWEDGSPFDSKRARELLTKLDAEAKEGRKAVKRLSELEKEAKARADAELTELEKAKNEIAELQQRITVQERREWQNEAAIATGLPLALASRIQGDTKEDMIEDAKALLEAMPVKTPPKLPVTNPGDPQTGETAVEKKARLLG